MREGIRAAGATAMEFNTVSISDGITMGTPGMRMSLVSREVIADSIELVAVGQPARRRHRAGRAATRRFRAPRWRSRGSICPGSCSTAGRSRPGHVNGRDVTIQDVFEAVGAHAAGRLSADGLRDLENRACPGAGACGGQFTANTMAGVCEFLGLSPMGSASVPARRSGQARRRGRGRPARRRSGPAQGHRARRSSRAPRSRTRSRRSPPRAARPTRCCTCWRSRARPASISISTSFDAINARVPWIADLKPAGRYRRDRSASRRRHARWSRSALRTRDCCKTDAITVTGRSIGEEARDVTRDAGPGRRAPDSTPRSRRRAAS